jgi:Resolvase, N terminal domain
LSRSLSDLLDTIQHLEACGVDLYLDQQAIDTTTPMGKLVFQLTGAFAEFERTMVRQRIKAGLKCAVAQDVKLGSRPTPLANRKNLSPPRAPAREILCDQHRRIVKAYSVRISATSSTDRAVVDPVRCWESCPSSSAQARQVGSNALEHPLVQPWCLGIYGVANFGPPSGKVQPAATSAYNMERMVPRGRVEQ